MAILRAIRDALSVFFLKYYGPNVVSSSVTPLKALFPGFGLGQKVIVYRSQGRLVAMDSVVILPKYIIAMYTAYDAHFGKSGIGKFIYAQGLHLSHLWNIPYFHSGWYVRTSEKMKYKDEFDPVELFCPVSRKWVTLTRAIRDKLDQGVTALVEPSKEDTPVNATQKSTVLFEVEGQLLSLEDLGRSNTRAVTEAERLIDARIGESIPVIVRTIPLGNQ